MVRDCQETRQELRLDSSDYQLVHWQMQHQFKVPGQVSHVTRGAEQMRKRASRSRSRLSTGDYSIAANSGGQVLSKNKMADALDWCLMTVAEDTEQALPRAQVRRDGQGKFVDRCGQYHFVQSHLHHHCGVGP